jgi:acetolactate decarboxylase
MFRDSLKCLLIVTSINFTFTTHVQAQENNHKVNVIGEMRKVMWEGKLEGVINLDTIGTKDNLYGLGPVEFLTGEVVIIDGTTYVSTVVSDSTMKVEEPYEIKAPFFAYDNIEAWKDHTLPDSIRTIKQLEGYLDVLTRQSLRPFMFKISGMVETATIHIVNLPAGSKVSSPAQAHQGQIDYELSNEQTDIVGFFSTEHKAIFTHHDTYVHMHLITKDRKKMGYLDEVIFKEGSLILYLPLD